MQELFAGCSIKKTYNYEARKQDISFGISETNGSCDVGGGSEWDHFLDGQPQLQSVETVGYSKLLFQFSLCQTLYNIEDIHTCTVYAAAGQWGKGDKIYIPLDIPGASTGAGVHYSSAKWAVTFPSQLTQFFFKSSLSSFPSSSHNPSNALPPFLSHTLYMTVMPPLSTSN